jgi:two-component system nitrate/nitrite response regulator NarL
VALRCLIVDDNAAFVTAARELLEREGMVVTGVASNRAAAIALAREHRPDVALVDVDLGEECGFDVARSLAGAHVHEAVRVVLVSAHGEPELAELIAASPAVGFLPKAALSARAVRAALAQGEPPAGRVLSGRRDT